MSSMVRSPAVRCHVRGITRRTAPTVGRQLHERREREGGPRTEDRRVVEWLLQVNEDTYYKRQRRAPDAIALTLCERENLPAVVASTHAVHLAMA
jgi:hypothetical protein